MLLLDVSRWSRTSVADANTGASQSNKPSWWRPEFLLESRSWWAKFDPPAIGSRTLLCRAPRQGRRERYPTSGSSSPTNIRNLLAVENVGVISLVQKHGRRSPEQPPGETAKWLEMISWSSFKDDQKKFELTQIQRGAKWSDVVEHVVHLCEERTENWKGDIRKWIWI